MSRHQAATRLTPWLLLCAFCLTLSTLAVRDRLDAPHRIEVSTRLASDLPPLPVVVLVP